MGIARNVLTYRTWGAARSKHRQIQRDDEPSIDLIDLYCEGWLESVANAGSVSLLGMSGGGARSSLIKSRDGMLASHNASYDLNWTPTMLFKTALKISTLFKPSHDLPPRWVQLT